MKKLKEERIYFPSSFSVIFNIPSFMISFNALDREGILFSNWKSSTFFKVSSSSTMLIIGFCVGITIYSFYFS